MSRHFRVYDGAYPHFITNTVMHWIPVFCREDYFRVLIDSFRYCIEHKGLNVHGFVLMPNHFHATCSQSEGRLPDVVRDLKRHTSTALAQKLKEDGRNLWLRAFENAGDGSAKIWDNDYHPMQIHSREFFEQKLAYMHNNPLRAGFVANAEDWKYSSAGFYYREAESVIPITVLDW